VERVVEETEVDKQTKTETETAERSTQPASS
jgi:hypothetical protein